MSFVIVIVIVLGLFFYVFSISLISDGDYPHYLLWGLTLCALPFVGITPVHTTFCGDYPCAHYLLWGLTLCALLFVGITPVHTTFVGITPVCTTFMCNDISTDAHYNITMGNAARDIHCDVIMHNDNCYLYITMHNDFAMNLIYYV